MVRGFGGWERFGRARQYLGLMNLRRWSSESRQIVSLRPGLPGSVNAGLKHSKLRFKTSGSGRSGKNEKSWPDVANPRRVYCNDGKCQPRRHSAESKAATVKILSKCVGRTARVACS